MANWSPTSWQQKPAKQQAKYPNEEALQQTLSTLETMPGLVSFEETQQLQSELARVCRGDAFLIQGGDCAETFDHFSENNVTSTFKVILQMAIVLTQAARKPIVKVGRIAGQFAKPRSSDTETRNGVTLPSYRGDLINGIEFNEDARVPCPMRLQRAYFQAAATTNVLRALSSSGTASLSNVHSWNKGFIERSSIADRYKTIADQVTASLDFMKACGGLASQAVQEINFFTSHEGLHLPYEQALLRKCDNMWFASSGHLLWIGDRTRQLDGAHIEFFRGIANPIALKVGPSMSPSELVDIIGILNPNNVPGRLTLITRFGADNIDEKLPTLIQAVKASGQQVIWVTDPMHGNTHTATNGLKTRSFDRILSELRSFMSIHAAHGTHAGGVHLEMTGMDVTECLGGLHNLTETDLLQRYDTACDPRLNADQVLEMAFILADELCD